MRLLLVEDNLEDEALTMRAIKGRNLEVNVLLARDGQAAVEMLGLEGGADSQELPDVVSLDLKLPKVSGLEVLAMMRANERTKNIPVLVLSSSDEPIDVEGAHRMGVEHLRKPDDFYDFLETVGAALERLCSVPNAPVS